MDQEGWLTIWKVNRMKEAFSDLLDSEDKAASKWCNKGILPTVEPQVLVNFSHSFPLLVCSACNQEFILIAWYGHEHGWGEQAAYYYCPYCGVKWPD